MKKQLLNKGYVFIFTVMLFSISANAQMVYTDVNPDDTTSQGTYNLDLNNDGTTDFEITHSIITIICNGPKANRYIRVTPLGTNQVSSYSVNNATKMALNANIDASVLTWNDSANQLMAYRTHSLACTPAYSGGQWLSAVDGYLGLKLNSGGNTYYGWARLNTSDANSFTIIDYAYNSIPNQPILAGEGQPIISGIIENSFVSSITLFPNPATNHLTISLESHHKKVQVTIVDMTGKIIYTATAREEQMLEVNTEAFAAGIYAVQIQTEDFIGTKKLILKK